MLRLQWPIYNSTHETFIWSEIRKKVANENKRLKNKTLISYLYLI